MNNNALRSKRIHSIPSILMKSFILLLIIVAFIVFANKVMEYRVIKSETYALMETYNNKLREAEELEYFLNSEIDEEYKERMARLMGYCYPDETIYYVE